MRIQVDLYSDSYERVELLGKLEEVDKLQFVADALSLVIGPPSAKYCDIETQQDICICWARVLTCRLTCESIGV